MIYSSQKLIGTVERDKRNTDVSNFENIEIANNASGSFSIMQDSFDDTQEIGFDFDDIDGLIEILNKCKNIKQ